MRGWRRGRRALRHRRLGERAAAQQCCFMPRQHFEQLPGAGRRERQRQPVGLGQSQGPLGRVVRGALVA